jgi:hypothetical protein
MTTKPEVNAMTTQPILLTAEPATLNAAVLTPAAAWSRRVRRIGHVVDIPRLRTVGWAMIAGPVILVATMSGPALAVTTGITAGVMLLATAAAGFHDLANLRQVGPPDPARLHAKAR